MSLLGKKLKIKTKNGTMVIIRDTIEDDAKQLISLGKAIASEEVYTLTAVDEIPSSVQDEAVWIKSHRETIGNLLLVAEANKTIIGVCDFTSGQKKKVQHTGYFGLGISENYRNQGIGSSLLSALLDWASSFKKIEKICLTARADNERAIFLYKKMGFVEEGLLKKDLKYSDGSYADSILMARFL